MGSAAQLGVGIRATRRGYAGNGSFMPLKALGVTSLFVGAIAAASMGTLRACDINKSFRLWLRKFCPLSLLPTLLVFTPLHNQLLHYKLLRNHSFLLHCHLP